MPDCHKCPHDGNPSAACLRCPGPAETPHHSGQTIYSLEAIQEAGRDIDTEHDLEPVVPDPASYNAFAHALRCIMALDSITRDIVCLRFLGLVTGRDDYSYRAIGERVGMTAQAVEMRHRRVLKDWPAMAEMFKFKAVRKKRGGV